MRNQKLSPTNLLSEGPSPAPDEKGGNGDNGGEGPSPAPDEKGGNGDNGGEGPSSASGDDD